MSREAPYTLRVTDAAGNSFFVDCADWSDVERYTGKYQGFVLDLIGIGVDLDSDGLTDQEREAFDFLLAYFKL